MKKSSFKRSLAMFLAILMLVTSFPIVAFATEESGTMPVSETTKNQPYIYDKPSKTYRIPGMVTLNDGTIVTSVDARWDSGMDGGGNDTMISRSTDNGKTWTYSFTNYYPDNGNVFNKASTGVCDSEIATDGTNVYLLTTFFPAGYALNNKSANNQLKNSNGTAFNSNGTLKLSAKGSTTFGYYLDLNSFTADGPDGRAPVMNNDGSETGYYVDHDYYLYKGTNKQDGNLFYSDGQYQTAKVNFLLFRKSTDGGATWSDFTPLNVKNGDEAFYGVGPGRGYVDASGRLFFSMYTWSTHWLGANDTQRSSFIFSDDGGKTWTRTPNVGELPSGIGDAGGTTNTKWTSESQLVEMNKGVMRCFVRNAWGKVIYFDATWDEASSNYTWSGYTDMQFRTANNSGCQLSVLKYSEKLQYNGHYYTAVVVSTPSGGSSRTNGKIYTCLFDEDNNPVNINNSYNQNNNKAIEYPINQGAYEYSCLTELNNGKLAVLYEAGGGTMIYNELPDITTVTGLRMPDGARTIEYSLARGDVKTFLTETNTATNSNPDVIGLTADSYKARIGVKATMGDSAMYDGETIWLKDALFNFTQNNDGTWVLGAMGVYMTVVQPGLPSEVTKRPVTIKQDGDTFLFVDSGDEALCYHRSGDKVNQFDQSTAYGTVNGAPNGDQHREMAQFEVYRPARVDEDITGSELPGYIRVTDMSDIKDGGQYLIGCKVNNVYYFLYPSTSTNNTYSHSVKVDTTPYDAGYYMTIKALRTGESTVVVDNITYIFKVTDYSNEILGVIDYDPVIYTHGNDPATPDMSFTYVGNIISDADYTGERYTSYRYRTVDGVDLSKKYKIKSIVALSDAGEDSAKIDGADISIVNDNGEVDGKLHGYLPLADNESFTPYNSGTYVLLKTTLIELDENQKETENTYVQTDKLYVASNPVPGHVISGVTRNSSGTGNSSRAQICTYLLAPQSIGNTVDSKAMGYKYGGYNAKHIFNWNRNSAYSTSDNSIMTYKDRIEDYTQINATNTNMIKGAAVSEHATGTKSWNYYEDTENRVLTEDQASKYSLAIYYYDVSSPKNEGITVGADKTDFSIVLQRKLVDVQYGSDKNWKLDVKIGTNDRTYIEKLSGDGTIDKQTYMYGNAGSSYTTTSYDNKLSDTQIQQLEAPLNVNCHATVAENKTTSLKGVFRLQEGNDTAQVWNDMRLPFEIKLCDKSVQRAAYNKTIEHVLKSTDYTTSSWKRYMDAVLIYQEYLNNYTILTPDEKKDNTNKTYEQLINDTVDAKVDENGNTKPVTTVVEKYNVIQKSAQFSILEKELEDNLEKRENGIMLSDGKNYTPDTYSPFIDSYDAGKKIFDDAGTNAEVLDPNIYTPDEIRAETPGWEVGPDSTVKLKIQDDIEKSTDAIQKNQPQVAGDASAYVAAKAESNNIDKTAYVNENDIDTIQQKFDESDKVLYKDFIYQDVNYGLFLNVTENEQNKIDFETAAALENMEVAKNRNNLRQYQVTFNVNGENVYTVMKNYGDIQPLDLSTYMTGDNVVKCEVNTDDHETSGKVATTVNVEDYAGMGYVIPVLVQQNITIDVTCKPKNEAKQVVVVDYYGTVTGILYAVDDTDSLVVDSNAVWLTSNPDVKVYVKTSPKYEFTGWSLELGNYSVTEPITIVQRGNLNPMVHEFTAENGKINSQGTFISNSPNSKLTLESETGKYWTRKVNGMTMLASYESSFVNFSSNEDVVYTAYDSIDAMKAANVDSNILNTAEKGTPVVYGTGYYANNMFTMSVDYSAPANSTNIKVLDAGVIYSTSDLGEDGLVKGAANTRTVTANRIAHWTDNANSGTFTMSKGNVDTGEHYMRAYVSYSATYVGIDENGKPKEYTLPYVAYSPVIYKCVNGNVEIAG